MYSSGRVLNGELLYTQILEVNLFALAYRLFHRDFSPINGIFWNHANGSAQCGAFAQISEVNFM